VWRRLGVCLTPRLSRILPAVLSARVGELGLDDPERYLRLLEEDEERQEWERLVPMLTVGESYFFRDAGQFRALRERVLPELLARGTPLRVWSAGCSSGEETYSLAILLHELSDGSAARRTFLIGTDINPDALERARRGHYGDWSFRSVDPGLRERWFRSSHDGSVLDDAIRKAATFRQHNLVTDTTPDTDASLFAMDLILCRNVLIYFDAETVKAVVRRLAETLRPGGYLMTGHAEFHSPDFPELEALMLEGTFIFRRRLAESPGRGERSVPTARTLAAPIPRLDEAVGTDALVIARELADAGRADDAERICAGVLEQDPFNDDAYHLLARLAEERRDFDEAKQCLQRALYLNPTRVDALVDLAAMCERANRKGAALRYYRSALQTLARHDMKLSERASDIAEYVQTRIEKLDSDG
jgi:chemotaxis protein methyltransferase CheR